MNSIFLENSQTFLGTIATLTILCVFSKQDSGNFIVLVLEGIRKQMEKQINLLKENTDMELPGSIRLLQFFLGKANIESELDNEGFQILREIRLKENELKSQYTIVWSLEKMNCLIKLKIRKNNF